ncbi:aromatic amino acid ammonia-lyase [Pseudonocardia sp. MH-G8]|uniref:aromatic amino acid ammonia-lyase n=1 Tax=Pseudonocardia sp. MH-G8 TaxID=1854588 RepID=UPI000BA0F1BA|nr:aromatic amino acid ammonia-lyase [Pseudonocardia sp. MH-G8]OZM80875.1 histidine ammonia-lyase [Pseudonocardia sp. MH-G8]
MVPCVATVAVDGATLRCADVVRIARAGDDVELADHALERAARAHELAIEISAKRTVYGRTTGVGANRHMVVDPTTFDEHGLRLLRSHSGGVGPALPDDAVRALLAIRLNQLAAAGSGVHPRLLGALVAALRTGSVPRVHARGAIGTGDLTAMAEVALTLAGERPWAVGGVEPVAISPGDALAFISSNASTLAQAVLAWNDLGVLLRASHVVAALSYLALGGSPEAFSQRVHLRRPFPGSLRCAAEFRALISPVVGAPAPGRRLQDPYGLRVFPQVQGPALDAADAVESVLGIDINAAAENPLIDLDEGTVDHHGQFCTPYLALWLDHLRAAAHHVAELSVARLSDLVEPELTGLPAFLASGPPGSSGIMILEYIAHDALAEMRNAAAAVTTGTAVISRGLEDHASFSTQAVRSTAAVTDAYRTVLACELVGAVRALRMANEALPQVPAAAIFHRLADELPRIAEDHPLGEEIGRAEELLLDLDARPGPGAG